MSKECFKKDGEVKYVYLKEFCAGSKEKMDLSVTADKRKLLSKHKD